MFYYNLFFNILFLTLLFLCLLYHIPHKLSTLLCNFFVQLFFKSILPNITHNDNDFVQKTHHTQQHNKMHSYFKSPNTKNHTTTHTTNASAPPPNFIKSIHNTLHSIHKFSHNTIFVYKKTTMLQLHRCSFVFFVWLS